MRLFLLRHAQAHETFPDCDRELTHYGETQIAKLCAVLAPQLFENLVQVWHSPFLRAERTAHLFCEQMKISAPLQKVNNITPEDNPKALAHTIAGISSFGGDLLIVSHNPFLEGLANTLIDSKNGGITFGKCTLAGLSLIDVPDDISPYGLWSTDFLISPKIVTA